MRIAAAAAHSFRNEKQLDESPTTAGFNFPSVHLGHAVAALAGPRRVDLTQGPPGAQAGTRPPRLLGSK